MILSLFGMNMPKLLKHNGYEILVKEATVIAGMRRSRMRRDGTMAGEMDNDKRILLIITYPDLVCVSEGKKGFAHWPPSFEEFIELPEALVIEWEQIAYELNPHWQPGSHGDLDEQEEIEKKMLTS